MPSTRSTVLVADGQPVAEALLGERGDGFIVGLHLPALAQDHTYQLWGVKENTILSLGVLGREPGIVPIAAAGSWSKLVLTVETSPGVAVSTQPALAVGDLI